MCGIFAVFNKADAGFGDAEYRLAVEAVSHRGPDAIDQFSDRLCFLGHTRLSILGIEESGNQPFYFEDLVMVFNGEIFNFIELRKELAGLGYTFKTNSDTEVVIKAYHQWGSRCFSKFNGMWAIVIYDKRKKVLIASRDRFGQKPMFVMRFGKAIFFASEFQQLVPFSDRVVNFELIQMFLKEGGYEGEGATFISSIAEFPKAHYFEIDSENRFSSFRYWDYWTGKVAKADDASFSEFSNLLMDAVRLRLRADVPYGLLLSGGVDSTLIAYYSRRLQGPEGLIPAFNFSSMDGYDESGYARKVAERLNLDLTIREQESNPVEYRERLMRLVKRMGRGHSSPAIISVDYLYESVAKAGIKVALDGQGADELLAGYKNYFSLVVPWFLLQGKLKQAYYCLVDQFRSGFLMTTILYLRNSFPPSLKKILRWGYGYEQLFRNYGRSPKRGPVKRHPSIRGNGNALNRYLIRQHDLGLENLLFYGDIVAMNNSVENRSPFMDHRLVEFVFSRSEKLKIWNGIDKYALRSMSAYSQFKDVLDRDKIGFVSDIRKDIKDLMVTELKGSRILGWPIFSDELLVYLERGRFAEPKFERLLFRLYQVHLWNDLFNNPMVSPVSTQSINTEVMR